MTEFAAEFVQRKVDVIVSSANGVTIARQATSSIPIVFAAFNDPVASGLVASLARPGGNVTGLTVQPSDLASKRIDLLRQIVPNFRRLAALANVAGSGFLREVEGIRKRRHAEHRGRHLRTCTADDIAPALARLTGRADALCPERAAGECQQGANFGNGGCREDSDDIWLQGVCRRRRPDVLRGELSRPVSSRRRLHRQDFAWRQARRHAGATARKVRPDRQSEGSASTGTCRYRSRFCCSPTR